VPLPVPGCLTFLQEKLAAEYPAEELRNKILITSYMRVFQPEDWEKLKSLESYERRMGTFDPEKMRERWGTTYSDKFGEAALAEGEPAERKEDEATEEDPKEGQIGEDKGSQEQVENVGKEAEEKGTPTRQAQRRNVREPRPREPKPVATVRSYYVVEPATSFTIKDVIPGTYLPFYLKVLK
jgi:hypothetical protein